MDDVDYADAIVSYFLEKRGKGSAESSRDQVKIERWEQDGVPLDDVLAAIALAFERSVEPPKSVSACGRWLTQAQKAATRAEGHAAAEVFETTTIAAEPDAAQQIEAVPDASQAADDAAEALLARLDALGRSGQHPALAHAAVTLAAEVRELLAEDGHIDDATRDALPEAWVELVLGALAPDEAGDLRAAAQADVAAQGLSRLVSDDVRRARHTAAMCRAIAARWCRGNDPIGSR